MACSETGIRRSGLVKHSCIGTGFDIEVPSKSTILCLFRMSVTKKEDSIRPRCAPTLHRLIYVYRCKLRNNCYYCIQIGQLCPVNCVAAKFALKEQIQGLCYSLYVTHIWTARTSKRVPRSDIQCIQSVKIIKGAIVALKMYSVLLKMRFGQQSAGSYCQTIKSLPEEGHCIITFLTGMCYKC